jgi:splicing factor U2AF subunit
MKISSVVVLNNAVRIKNIEDDYEYNFVVKDLKKEIEKIGRLISMVVPRRKDGYNEGIGKVFVEFENE